MSASQYFTGEELRRLPAHVAAIMDGNGRWAQSRGLPRTAGHREGAETFRRIAEFMNELGIGYFTVYAFSSENWKRPAEEVSVIMGLLERYLLESVQSMAEKNIRLRFFGDLTPLPERLRRIIDRTDEISRGTTGLQVNVCLNYGGRQEIARAARLLAEKAARGELDPAAITPELLGEQLYSAGVPDPDLIIRTGRELRISNFLLWQCAYSEFYFSDKLWPDMDEDEIIRAIRDYLGRKRRFGGL